MPEQIPDPFMDLFEKRAFANLATLMPDGQPQVTPVWCNWEDGHVWINSARGRQKDRNIQRDPLVSLSLADPENPYRYLEVRGRVVEITEQGADAHINSLAKKYLDLETYPRRKAGEVRVIYKVLPERVRTQG